MEKQKTKLIDATVLASPAGEVGTTRTADRESKAAEKAAHAAEREAKAQARGSCAET